MEVLSFDDGLGAADLDLVAAEVVAPIHVSQVVHMERLVHVTCVVVAHQ